MLGCSFKETQAARFAALALDCVHKPYPNKIAHSLNSDADVKPPRELTPAFYGCYDWHSPVHGHWLLVRLARSLTPANLAQEVIYLNAGGRNTVERPYGLAWLLQLAAELKEFDKPEARQWSAALRPLEQAVTARVTGNAEFGRVVESRVRDYYLKDRNCPLAYEPSGEDFLSPCWDGRSAREIS